jgi:hypothetical protein
MNWTEGEIKVQKRIWGDVNNDMPNFTRDYMTQDEKMILKNANYIFLSFLDDNNRPWGTIITGEKGFINIKKDESIEIILNQEDNNIINKLIIEKLKDKKVFNEINKITNIIGCMYIDFNTLYRYKFSGFFY